MNVFITGSTGLLGSSLLRTMPTDVACSASYHVNRLVPAVDCTYYHVDITKKETLEEAFKIAKPDVVIHTAAQASPDYCDKHEDEATLVNVEGTKHVIEACKSVGASMVFITTNGVYDGKEAPYDEDALKKPVDVYGRTKVEGERLVETSGIPYVIVRLNTMYGWNNPSERQNPVTWLIQMIGENKTSVNMVTDMSNTFLYSVEAANAIWRIVESDHTDTYFNISGKECLSRYDFSFLIATEFDLNTKMISPVTRSFFTNFVERPQNTCFTNEKMKRVLGMPPMPSKDALSHMHAHPLSTDDWKTI